MSLQFQVVPVGQLQDVPLCSGAEPGGHAVQVRKPPRLAEPSGHDVQDPLVRSVQFHICPPSQLHAAPSSNGREPVGHVTHCDAPIRLIAPSGHAMHLWIPLSTLKVLDG